MSLPHVGNGSLAQSYQRLLPIIALAVGYHLTHSKNGKLRNSSSCFQKSLLRLGMNIPYRPPRA